MLKKNACGILFLFFMCGIFTRAGAVTRPNVTDWYISDFDSKITVNKDSSLGISETITADCANAVGKHGIFRILPNHVTVGGKKIKMPVKLISITDQNGRLLQYSEAKNSETVTWKIGDPDVTVNGVNIYKINYVIDNTIRFGNDDFDELYWNLYGNFWDLQTDHFHAAIIFPQEVNQSNATVDYYTGTLGSKSKDLAAYRWSAPNVLEFESTKMLDAREGITASIIFPKGIFSEYRPSFWESYGQFAYFLIPFAIFATCFFLWRKYGDDPEVCETIIAEYDAPGNLSPVELGMLMKNGAFDNDLITAELINFATKGLIMIKETHEKILFFDTRDYELQKMAKPEAEEKLSVVQKEILEGIFEGKSVKKLSELKNSFYKKLPQIKKSAEKLLKEKNLIVPAGMHIGLVMKLMSGVGIWITFVSFGSNLILGLCALLSALIVLGFSFIMPKRTVEGAKLNVDAKGFKLFMNTVDKDRAVFYEKENIFEKFLPYAIMFGITGEWIKRMQEIYGEEYFATYAPVWYAGAGGSFDADSFSTSMDSLSSAIAASTSSPSGSGGSGGSGGGGGGGSGGGW